MSVNELSTHSQTELLRHISALAKRFRNEGDAAIAEKLEELRQRAETDTNAVYVAFVGLFSAGKSSLLNTLCNSHLATGAVPTTAQATRVTLPDSENQVILMDTPGVDSTDDAHQEATEQALHLADAIVLVMDYQHVEAEENLELAQQFADGNKDLVIVVNQVDKHLDFELSFDDFRNRVVTTLDDWDISYEHLFFTTNKESPYNQLGQFRDWLQKVGKRDLSSASNTNAKMEARNKTAAPILLRVEEMISEHVDWAFQARWRQKSDLAVEALGYELGSLAEIQQHYKDFEQRVETLQKQLAAKEDDLSERHEALSRHMMRSIESAQIAPYETTEKGKAYIESCRPGFSVGWIRKQEKTREEQQQRLQSFVSDLSERAAQFLLWPTQTELRQNLQEEGWLSAKTEDKIAAMEVSVTTELCKQLVSEGALVSESYSHQYVADVVSRIKGQCNRQVKQILDDVKHSAEAQLQQNTSVQREELRHAKQVLGVLGDMIALSREQQTSKQEYMDILNEEHADG